MLYRKGIAWRLESSCGISPNQAAASPAFKNAGIFSILVLIIFFLYVLNGDRLIVCTVCRIARTPVSHLPENGGMKSLAIEVCDERYFKRERRVQMLSCRAI
jgi:hypothetical protein